MDGCAMRKILLAFALCLAASAASAQCNGVFPNQTVCGNVSGSPAPPTNLPLSSFALGPGGSNGEVQYNNGSGGFGGALYTYEGVDGNALNVMVSSHTIDITDCTTTISAGTGSTGQFTLILPSVSGFPSTCSILIKNTDTTNGKILSGFPADLPPMLWPSQSVGVKIVNGAWQSFYNPGRFRITSTRNFFVNPTGSDSNDGLTTATPFATIYGACNILAYALDFNGNSAALNLASASFTMTNPCQAFSTLEGAVTFDIVPPASGMATITIPSGGTGFYAKDRGIIQVGTATNCNLTIEQVGGGIAFNSAQFSDIDIGCVTWEPANVGADFVLLESNGHAGFDVGATFTMTVPSGNWVANWLVNASEGSIFYFNNATVDFTVAGSWNTAGLVASSGSIIELNSSYWTGTITGSSGLIYSVDGYGSQIMSNGADPNDFVPGLTPGKQTTGGIVVNPPAPMGNTVNMSFTVNTASPTTPITYSGCGFTPSALDVSGIIGTGVSAGVEVHGSVDSAFNGSAISLLGGGNYYPDPTHGFLIGPDNTDLIEGTVTAYGLNTFSMTWSKIGSPTGTATFFVTCHR
jgi:hypothetical protein